MGDYNKLIVACSVKKEIKEDLEYKVEELRLSDSAYQSQEMVVSIQKSTFSSYKETRLDIVLVGQTKWGCGQDEFLEWLKPNVIQGSGQNDVFAIQFSEHSDTPTLWKMSEEEEI